MKKKQSLLKKELRLDIIYDIIWARRKKYLLSLGLTAVLSYVIICCVPRTYSVDVMLAPEYENGGSSMGSLAGLASLANINLGNMSGGNDAIVPTFYPDLMKSTDFIVPLFDVVVSTADGSFKGSYKDYLLKKQDAPWWNKLFLSLKQKLSSKPMPTVGEERVDPFRLTKGQEMLVMAIEGSISCSIDEKTDVISLTVTAQDALVAAQLANAVKAKLQEFIIEYRTKKTRIEMEHMQKVANDTHQRYIAAQKAYAAYADTHQDVELASYRVKEEELENDLQAAYNAYSTAKLQETMARGKLLSRTPAFTTLQNATVPLKPTGPKRMIFVVFMLLLVFLIQSVVYVIKYRPLVDEATDEAPLIGTADGAAAALPAAEEGCGVEEPATTADDADAAL
jgi:hypothetical protein